MAEKGIEGLLVDIDTGVLRPDRMLVQSGSGAVVFLGFGPRARRLRRFAFDEGIDTDSFIARCRELDQSAASGKLAKAQDYGIPRAVLDIADRPLRRLAIAEILAKAGYNPDQPRVPAGSPDGGEWTTDGGEGAERGTNAASDADTGAEHSYIRPVAEQIGSVQEKKGRFVDSHLADTRSAAAQLGVPVENILGVAAEESGWGTSRFAKEGNNFFGIHYPAPNAIAYIDSGQDGKMSVFENYTASLRSFVMISGSIVQGKADPEEFARALQNSGKFGINVATGAKMPNYVSGLAGTIRGLRAIVARRRL